MLRPTHIAETALYVDDLDRAASFYIALFAGEILRRDDRLCALHITNEQVLLLFRRGASATPATVPGGMIPGHDGTGPAHVCFGIRAADLEGWQNQLRALDIAIESRVEWPSGATSLYFRDADGHAIELATPGLWRRE